MRLNGKNIIIMGGGTAGWVSALYFLNMSKKLYLKNKVKLISSKKINPIGVGEGTTPVFTEFLESFCGIDKKKFLKETKGSFKYGIKFSNWNFDQEYYYHTFTYFRENFENNIFQNIIDKDLNIEQKLLQKKYHKFYYDVLENNEASLNPFSPKNSYAFHFSADLLILFLKNQCLEFDNFEHIESNIQKINYSKNGFIDSLKLNEESEINGDFFVNCLGFNSNTLLSDEYFDIENWDNCILNNSAFAIQVKNSLTEIIEPYTTSTAQEYGWTWKIPQYEKTGYGYVYSDNFINDEDKLYDDLLKTYNIKKQDVFKTRIVKSKPYYNKKQLHKNCLSLGLSSGFIEPLEATSIHMTLDSLNSFYAFIINKEKITNEKIIIFNSDLEKKWRNIFEFIIFHYFTNNPINDYWKHYKKIQSSIKLLPNITGNVFDIGSYHSVVIGMKIKNIQIKHLNKEYFEKEVDKNFHTMDDYNDNCHNFYNIKKLLKQINEQKEIQYY